MLLAPKQGRKDKDDPRHKGGALGKTKGHLFFCFLMIFKKEILFKGGGIFDFFSG
jgi:hypothetical protein